MNRRLVTLGALALACGGPSRIEMEPRSLRFFGRGQTLTVHAAPFAKNGRPVPGKVCHWSSTDEKVATVSLVGEGVHREPRVAASMFTALAAEKINIDLISTSNLMLTCVVPEDRVEDAVRALHRRFFEEG